VLDADALRIASNRRALMTQRLWALTVAALAVAILLAGGGRADAGPSVSCLADKNPVVTKPCDVPAGADLSSVPHETITIADKGVLNFQDGAAITKLKLNSIVVESGGTLQAGTAANPIGKTPGGGLEITFTGAPGKCDTIDAGTDFCGKGLLVKPGGSLKLYGAKGVLDGGVSWTHLRDAAGPTSGAYVQGAHVAGTGITTLKLAKDVTKGAGAWRGGDWIVVATTSFSPFESEFVQIDTVTSDGADGATVTLKSNTFLTYYHFGGKDPGPPSTDNYTGPKATAEYNYGVDERAEVGLITRSIRLTAQLDDPKVHWGGEIKLMHGSDIVLQGVEIEKFGKAKLGAYPIHLHVMGDVANKPVLNSNSVHHSYNKCFTIHTTQNATISNNVCARIIGHIFYQEIGDEGNTTFLGNLGLGAMSHHFDIHGGVNGTTRDDLIKAHWWRGDYLVKQQGYNYDGFNVPNTDSQGNPTRGWCYTPDPSRAGGLTPTARPPCDASLFQLYFEPPSGFWIINPQTTLKGNSIGGCQGVGRAYWYVPPDPSNTGGRSELEKLRWTPIGEFSDNRAHGCYSGLYAESEFDVQSTQLFPREGGDQAGKSKLLTFNAFTATRNRDRGVWIRPVWVVVQNSRFASNKHNVSLVTTGGIDGNAPGVWSLLTNSVSVGASQNNVDRFGPCPNGNPTLLDRGFGCIDQTMSPQTVAVNDIKGGDVIGAGYPNFQVGKQLYGYLIYDGPARIFHNRFVNFKKDIKPALTTQDLNALGGNPYEGDAALGWFNSNPSQYPSATASSGLVFENVDLRHQVFTEKVNTGTFADGDKNTAILDIDGTLGGYIVVDKTGKKAKEAFAMSLNNLPFNTSGNAVAECLSVGLLDEQREAGRPTALMTPASIGTLEFEALYPFPPEKDKWPDICNSFHFQAITFSKDAQDFGAHQSMTLFSRNGLGAWEPKVASGEGYTVSTAPGKPQAANPPGWCQPAGTLAGIPPVINVGVADIVKPEVGKDNPFWIRLGICYTDKNGNFPTGDKFTIKRGYKSYGGGFAQTDDLGLRKFWNQLNQRYKEQSCQQLDSQVYVPDGTAAKSTNLDPVTGCPADGVTPAFDNAGEPTEGSGTCPPDAKLETDQQGKPACIYHKTELTLAKSISELATSGKPVLDKFYYDASKGLLFLNVAQEFPNPIGPSPLGDCKVGSAPPCPTLADGETYYACPPQGCLVYNIRINDPSYEPGASKCQPYPTYAQERPVGDHALAYVGNGNEPFTKVVTKAAGTTEFPYYDPTTAPVCPMTTPRASDTEDSSDTGE
jgi:hypothetical protein